MSGPSTTRAGVNAAPLPGLTQPVEQLLQGFLQNPAQTAGRFQPTSALQSQIGNTFSQLLSGGLIGGESVINAAQPIFEQNLQTSADILRQEGPRFASGTQRRVQDLSQRSLQDFNLFQEQTLASGQNRFLQGLLGAGQFSLGQSGQQNQLIQQLLGGAFNLGTGPAVLQQNPGTLSDILGVVGTAGGLVTGLSGLGGISGLLGRGGTTRPGTPRGQFPGG